MPNFFNYFALVLFFIVVSPIIPTAISPISPTTLGPTTYLYIHISICIYLGICPNSINKQYNKTKKLKHLLFFFYYFFSLVNTYIAIIHFYFGKNKLYQTFFLLLSIIFLWSYNSFIFYMYIYADTNSFLIIQVQTRPVIFTGIINIYIFISLLFAFFFSYYSIFFFIILYSYTFAYLRKT